jgi:hypothetical protein
MEMFFVRKQIVVGAIALACLELGVMLIKVLTH